MSDIDTSKAVRRSVRGQATLEYAVCLLAFAAVVSALAAIWRASSDGRFLQLAIAAASHTPHDLVGFAKDFALF